MKFLRSSVLMAAAVAITAFSSCATGSAMASEAGTLSVEMPVLPYHLRRDLAGSSSDAPPPTSAPPATTAPPPPTTAPPPPPTTTAPAPTTTVPATTSPAPTTATPETTAPATTEPPTTTEPSTTAPAPTTASPTTDAPTTPEPTTAGPATTKPPTSGSTGTEITEPPVATRDSSTDGNNAGKTPKPAAGSSDTNASTPKDSKMSAGAIIGIVCGIVGGVAILAIIAVVLARKRRNNEDDDPLSPFELSMDKGYGGVPVMQNANQYGPNNSNASNGYSTNNGYSGARTNTNNSAMIGGAAVGAGVGMGVGAAMLTTDTPQASDPAGVTYTQFYDVVTSPGSMYPQRVSTHTDDNIAPNNDSNLWMSAMEPKDNDVEGASVPPEVSLPGDECDDNSSSFISRNSYDQIVGSESIDIDQSSVLSGGSDLEKEFPDYEDESSRGSYEL